MDAKEKAAPSVKVGIEETALNNRACSTLSPVYFQACLSTITFLSAAVAWWGYLPYLAILFIREVAR